MRSIKFTPIIPVLLLAACNNYDIQPEQAEGFIKFYSSNLTETAYDVKETADGGYVVVGSTITDEESGARDIYLVMTDEYGNEKSWSPVTIEGGHDDVGTCIEVVSDGFIILGSSRETDTSDYDIYLLKTDFQGAVTWESRADALSDEFGKSLEITSIGEYLTVGTRADTEYDKNDAIIIKFNENGEYYPPRLIESGGNDWSVLNANILETEQDYVISATLDKGGNTEIQIISVNKENLIPNNGLPLNSDGDLYGNCIRKLEDGNLLVCGTVFNPSTGLSSIYLNKITPDLEVLPDLEPYKSFSATGQVSLSGNAVRVVNNSSYAIIGTRTETGNDDIILLHTDASGNEVSRRVFGDDGFQQGVSLELTGFDGGLILVGNNGAEDQSMMALVKTDASGNL
jgi:hypothetical protein